MANTEESPVIKRPAIIDEFKRRHAVLKQAEQDKKECTDEVRVALKEAGPKAFADVWLVQKQGAIKVDTTKAIQWARDSVEKGTMTMDEYKSLFVRVLDEDAFTRMARKLPIEQKKIISEQNIIYKEPDPAPEVHCSLTK